MKPTRHHRDCVSWSLDTRSVHAGAAPDVSTGSVMPPVVLSSTFAQPALGSFGPFAYGRVDNPTRARLEQAVAQLEGALGAVAFASGCAAMSAVLQALGPGAKVLAAAHLYGGTQRLLHEVFVPQQGATVNHVPAQDLQAVADRLAAFRPQALWVESPSNPWLELCDIKALAALCQAQGTRLIVDNTFATPILQQPFSLGADVVVHSSSKYLNGHSDVVGGLALARDPALLDAWRRVQRSVGAVPSPFDAYLTLRGLKTLALRMRRHAEGAQALADALRGHPAIQRLAYPFAASHPQYALAQRQMHAGGGVLTLDLRGGEQAAARFVDRTRLFTLAESLGGVESLLGHPATMSHASLSEAERQAQGITPGTLRLSVGIEAPKDLVADVLNALS
ncbi:MAG: trans-sulfuration enzyme family protein [Polyangiales bacterium]